MSPDGFSLDIDVSDINDWSDDSNYTGISYDEYVGVWFHISIGSTFEYDNDGKITQYSHGSQGWYDTGGERARIPEPSSLLLLAAGLLGFRKFKS